MTGLNTLYKKAVPVNIRTFVETVLGNQNPITEQDFSPEELQTLRNTIAGRQKFNLEREGRLRESLRTPPQEYYRRPEVEYDDALQRKPLSYPAFLEKKQRELDSFTNTSDRTSFSYGDYPIKSGDMAAPVLQNWFDALYQSYNDPGFRLASTLGSAKYQDGHVVDSYGFTDNHPTYGVKSSASLADIFKMYGDSPGSLGEILFYKYYGDRRRPVNIKLP